VTELGLAIVLALGGFFVVRGIASRAVSVVASRPCVTATQEAAQVFARAIGPTIVAAGVAAIVLLPAFLIYEPADTREQPGLVLAACALAGACQLCVIAARAARMLLNSRRLTRVWLRDAIPLSGEPWRMPAAAIDAGFPVVAAAGLLHPRLFIDHRVLDACSPGELEAVAAHERAHVSRYDNVRRLLVGALHGPTSRIATAWRTIAEHAADEQAADSPARAIELASALVKVARLAPPAPFHHTAVSAIHDGTSLESRVQRLLSRDGCRSDGFPTVARRWRRSSVLLTVVMAVGGYGPALHAVHSILEVLVRTLP
jgi:Peptidase family M48